MIIAFFPITIAKSKTKHCQAHHKPPNYQTTKPPTITTTASSSPSFSTTTINYTAPLTFVVRPSLLVTATLSSIARSLTTGLAFPPPPPPPTMCSRFTHIFTCGHYTASAVTCAQARSNGKCAAYKERDVDHEYKCNLCEEEVASA